MSEIGAADTAHHAHEHDPGDQLGAGRDDGARPRRASCSARTSAISAACSARPTGLQAKYGKTRVFDTPITEGGIVGVAVGMGAYGLRPVRRDPVRRLHLSGARPDRVGGGAAALSLGRRVHRADDGPHRPAAAASSAARRTASRPRRMFTHVSGLKTVIPSNPYDAKGLLIAAIEDDDPVIFFEPKRIYNGPFDGHHDRPVTPWSKHPRGEVPEGYYTVPLGKAAIVREGEALTVLCLRHDGACRAGGGRGDRRRRRDHRPAHARAARHRDDRGIGEEDRPLRDRARGDAHLRASAPSCRRWCRSTASTISKRRSSASTGWDTPYPHSLRMGLFPRPGPRRRRRSRRSWRPERWRASRSSCPTSAKASPRPRSSRGTSRSATRVEEDQRLADMMTDKATVEMKSPVAGKVVELAGEVGDQVPIGSTLVVIEAEGDAAIAPVRAKPSPMSHRANCAATGRGRRDVEAESPGRRGCRGQDAGV